MSQSVTVNVSKMDRSDSPLVDYSEDFPEWMAKIERFSSTTRRDQSLENDETANSSTKAADNDNNNNNAVN